MSLIPRCAQFVRGFTTTTPPSPLPFLLQASHFAFDDHNPPPLSLLSAICDDMHSFLGAHPKNVVAVHCKAGKGRTGCAISAYLVHAGLCASANEALNMFGKARTLNNKGVTIPSQMRYVHYFETERREGARRPAKPYSLKHVRLITVPNFDVGGGCDPYFHVKLGSKKVFDFKKAGKVAKARRGLPFFDLDLSGMHCVVLGDVKLVFYDQDQVGNDDKMFSFWFNTGFIDRQYLRFSREVIDGACKSKGTSSFDKNFQVELFFADATEADVRDSHIGGFDADHDEDTDDEGDD